MKQLLLEITKKIVDYPDGVAVDQSDEDETGLLTLTLHVDPKDMGKVIGKQGKTISALRVLARVAAIKKRVRVHLQLAEPNKMEEENINKEQKPDIS